MSAAAVLAGKLPAPRARRQQWVESLAGLGFATPAFILLLLTNLAPLAALAFLSFRIVEEASLARGIQAKVGEDADDKAHGCDRFDDAVFGARKDPRQHRDRDESEQLKPNPAGAVDQDVA